MKNCLEACKTSRTGCVRPEGCFSAPTVTETAMPYVAGNVFSFRAECAHDVSLLWPRLSAVIGDGRLTVMQKPLPIQGHSLRVPDVQVEIEGALSMEDVLCVMRLIPDSHVMVQTLRPVPLAENSLERDPAAH